MTAQTIPFARHWLVVDLRRGEVIHAALPVVQTSPLAEYAAADIRIEIRAAPGIGDVIVQRARSQIGRKYNLLWTNCEQFARWAATGAAQSVQLQRAAAGISAAAFFGWLILGDHGTYDANGRLRDKKGRFKRM